MAIGTTAAILGAAAVGAGATLIGSSNAANAARRAGDQQAQAAADQMALQREIYQQQRADNEPFRQIGLSSAQALAGGLGLMTNNRSDPAAVTATAPVSMTGGGQAAPNYAAYGAQNPDVQGEASRVVGSDPRFQTPADYYAWHWQNYGQYEGRDLPMTAPQTAPALPAPTEGGTPAGYTDPTAPSGYEIGARPDIGPAPAPYVDNRVRPTLDLSLDTFYQDPGYELRLAEGNEALDRIASSSGNRFSGQRLKSATRYNQDFASNEFDRFAGRQMGIYGMDLAQYNTDRGFDYGQYRDQYGDYLTDRARSDGLYDDDRRYLAGRYDTRNNTLLNLAGFGTGANAANQSAAQSFASQQGQSLMTAANARGNAGINAANAWNQGLNNLMTTGAYLWGSRGGSGGFGGGGATPYSLEGLY